VNMSKGKALGFIEDEQGIIRFQNRICVPQRMEQRERINKAYNVKYSIDLGGRGRSLRQTF